MVFSVFWWTNRLDSKWWTLSKCLDLNTVIKPNKPKPGCQNIPPLHVLPDENSFSPETVSFCVDISVSRVARSNPFQQTVTNPLNSSLSFPAQWQGRELRTVINNAINHKKIKDKVIFFFLLFHEIWNPNMNMYNIFPTVVPHTGK